MAAVLKVWSRRIKIGLGCVGGAVSDSWSKGRWFAIKSTRSTQPSIPPG